MSELFEKAIVEKRNVLNEIRSNGMTLQELRFFSIYLSKINPRDKTTRVVRFPLEDFQKIMGFGRLNISQLKASTDSLLCKVVHIPDERGGYLAFTLFKRCRVFRNENDEWFVEIDASDDALPLMFDFKEKYFKYELWNALRLKGSNQLRMYEILKQYEKIGRREIAIGELRELLGIGKKEYSGRTGWSDFKKKVLDSCQAALKEYTDICYTYERGKTGTGGKWLTIVFHIEKNPDYVDKLSLKEFIDLQPAVSVAPSVSPELPEPRQKRVAVNRERKAKKPECHEFDAFLSVFGFEPNDANNRELKRVLEKINPLDKDEYMQLAYNQLIAAKVKKAQKGEKSINDCFGYFCKILENEITPAKQGRAEIRTGGLDPSMWQYLPTDDEIQEAIKEYHRTDAGKENK